MSTKAKDNLSFNLRILFIAIALSACSSKVQNNKKERPNIIFLMDDQHRWDALGVENELVYTPNLDKLAKEGIRFTQAVCQAPMCIPRSEERRVGGI